MNYNINSAKHPSMKSSVLMIILFTIVLIAMTLALPWYKKVVSINDYFYTISRIGASDNGVLPVIIPLVFVLVISLVNVRPGFKAISNKLIFFVGLWISLYSAYYYCSVTSNEYTTPGFGALAAVVGGILLMLISIIRHSKD